MTKRNNYSKAFITTFFLTTTLACADANFVNDERASDISSVTGVTKTVTESETVAPGNKQVDFLLVLDDSNSMAPELAKLAARMSTFVTFLEASQIDWQMCVTTTRNSLHGSYMNWSQYTPPAGSPAFVLKKGPSNLNSIFKTTISGIAIGAADSGDERGIKSAFVSFKNGGPCYRPGAAVSVIAISDEDERSYGGDASVVKPIESLDFLLPLQYEDIPANLVTQAQTSFGKNVRFTFNSIIVKPGDKKCEKEQDDAASPSHPGVNYAEISRLTEGGVGSICDDDYSANLNTFKNKIVNSLAQYNLQCDPVPGTLKVWVNKKLFTGFKAEKKLLKFASELNEGTRIDLEYDCKE